MKIDWAAPDFDWRDESLDEYLAKDWLANERLYHGHAGKGLPPNYDLDVDAWALELVQSDLDPERGWRFVLKCLRMAVDNRDVGRVGIALLETFLANHAEDFVAQIETEATDDPKSVAALEGIYWPNGRAGAVIRRVAGTVPDHPPEPPEGREWG